MKYTAHLLCALFVGAIAVGGCADATTDPPAGETTPSSFEQLQTRVLTKSCATAGCHVAGSAMAAQSGLVLEASVAHANLVGVAPKNEAALADGLLRVKPGSPDSSFLLIKLKDLSTHPGYGARMPLGADHLSDGQIEFIRQWIAAGAPSTGVVADAGLLADSSHGHDEVFTPLAPPSPGEGFQITTGLFDVAPNFERELFIYRRVGNTEPVYINRIETKMRPGSHHLVLYTLPANTPSRIVPALDQIRDIRALDGSMLEQNMQPMGYHLFFSGAMTPHETYNFPAGVALKVPANVAIDMNSHYVNITGSPRPGEAFANFYTVDSAEVQHVARPLFLNYDEFSLPPQQRTTVTRTFRMPARRSIFLLNSHVHKRGERYVIKISGGARNGEIVYTSTDWEHPPVKVFDPPIVLNAGEGLTSEVTYYNETSRTIQFGLTSEDEMDIIYAYYY
jgi:hypothetical protein